MLDGLFKLTGIGAFVAVILVVGNAWVAKPIANKIALYVQQREAEAAVVENQKIRAREHTACVVAFLTARKQHPGWAPFPAGCPDAIEMSQ
jgi:hypothetical protein